MSTCQKEGCNNPVFAKLYCKRHQYLRTDEGYQKYKSLKKQGKIKPRTPARAKEEKYYSVEAKEKWLELVQKGKNICFFCNKKVEIYNGWHHTSGREGKKITQWEHVVLCHNKCHLDYHYMPVGRLMQEEWYEDFMLRLKEIDQTAWYKQKNKEQKAQLNLEM